jgi:hypothetical protein
MTGPGAIGKGWLGTAAAGAAVYGPVFLSASSWIAVLMAFASLPSASCTAAFNPIGFTFGFAFALTEEYCAFAFAETGDSFLVELFAAEVYGAMGVVLGAEADAYEDPKSVASNLAVDLTARCCVHDCANSLECISSSVISTEPSGEVPSRSTLIIAAVVHAIITQGARVGEKWAMTGCFSKNCRVGSLMSQGVPLVFQHSTCVSATWNTR